MRFYNADRTLEILHPSKQLRELQLLVLTAA